MLGPGVLEFGGPGQALGWGQRLWATITFYDPGQISSLLNLILMCRKKGLDQGFWGTPCGTFFWVLRPIYLVFEGAQSRCLGHICLFSQFIAKQQQWQRQQQHRGFPGFPHPSEPIEREKAEEVGSRNG